MSVQFYVINTLKAKIIGVVERGQNFGLSKKFYYKITKLGTENLPFWRSLRAK